MNVESFESFEWIRAAIQEFLQQQPGMEWDGQGPPPVPVLSQTFNVIEMDRMNEELNRLHTHDILEMTRNNPLPYNNTYRTFFYKGENRNVKITVETTFPRIVCISWM